MKAKFRRLHSDESAVVFMEYSMLLALVGIVGLSVLMPGGVAYMLLRADMIFRASMIGLPFF